MVVMVIVHIYDNVICLYGNVTEYNSTTPVTRPADFIFSPPLTRSRSRQLPKSSVSSLAKGNRSSLSSSSSGKSSMRSR